VRAVADDAAQAGRAEALRSELVERLEPVLLAERDALAVEVGLTAFTGAELAILRSADALERQLR
jgi:hypothetical protein